MNSPVNAGYWTEQNEEFYRTRREEIRNGTATLKNARQWKQVLKQGGPSAKRFQSSMENMYHSILVQAV